MSTAALQWVAGRDTGVSSMTIWAVMMDAVNPFARSFDYDVPHDPDDFGRCYRLLQQLPEWRDRLPEVAARFPKWGPLVAAWGELEEMYRAVVATGGWDADASRRMYERMRALVDAGYEADGWERTGSGWRKERAS